MNQLVPHLQIEAIQRFCQQNHVRRLALFGSALRDDFGPESDIDILVEFEEGHVPGFLGMAQLEIEFGELIGRKVDLRTAAELSPYFRQDVLEQAVQIYGD